MLRKLIQISLLTVIVASYGFAQTEITGKVVGVADGDTITVLCSGNEQKKVRLFGIDCPEKSQDFGRKAKQFTSSLVFGRQVRVVQEDIDRYGRTVGIIYLDNLCVNEEIIKNGFAWVYINYCDRPMCQEWIKNEAISKENKIGLWTQKNPTPPWDFRHGKPRTNSIASKRNFSHEGLMHGNVKSRVFHTQTCKYYNCSNCTENFKSRTDAINSGYRPCKICDP